MILCQKFEINFKSLGGEPRAVLVLDNCSAHPDPEELASNDRAIYAMFSPANVTALIQPMDQGVIQSVKMRYRKKLLQRLIIADDFGGFLEGSKHESGC